MADNNSSIDDDFSILAHKFAALSLLEDDEAFVDVVDVDDIFDDEID